MISITALVLVISIGFLVPKAAAQSDKYPKMAANVRSYIAEAVGQMLETIDFIDALRGYLLPDDTSQSRITIVLERLKEISSAGSTLP
jgi:hypothetical protein